MEELTKTENKIAHGISQGYIWKELADKMCISVHTVHTHARNIRKKIGARNIADITRLYILSLDDPKLILKAMFFLTLHIGIIVKDHTAELRRPVQRTARANRTRNSKNLDYYA